MKGVIRVLGWALLLLGMIGIASILGGVFSHTPGFTSVGELAPAFAFHAICMTAGTYLVGRTVLKKGPVEAREMAAAR